MLVSQLFIVVGRDLTREIYSNYQNAVNSCANSTQSRINSRGKCLITHRGSYNVLKIANCRPVCQTVKFSQLSSLKMVEVMLLYAE